MRTRIKYSQNFLKSSHLIRELLRKSSICSDDVVYEIGAGEGIITQELLSKAKKVVAFELDKKLLNKLAQKFRNKESLELKGGDFLSFNLPSYPYKVFSNIPFNITSTIIKKLTLGNNPPQDSYLIVQREAAMKFVGKPLDTKNSQIAVLLHPWFEFRVIHEFRPTDFSPIPSVKIILLEIKKRDKFLIDNQRRDDYYDFVTYTFNQFKPDIVEGLSKVLSEQNLTKVAKESGLNPNAKPSELDFKDWTILFNLFLKVPPTQQKIVRNSYVSQLKQQQNLEKIHRTRVDKNWRKY